VAGRSRFILVAAALAGSGLILALAIGLNPQRGGPALAAPDNHATVSVADSAKGPVAMGNGVLMGADLKHDKSAPLRQLQQYPAHPLPQDDENDGEVGPDHAGPNGADQVVQNSPATPNVPATTLNFEGIDFPGVVCNCAPPDTNGEVGATQYVQIVNEGYEVWDKTSGASVYGPVAITTIWSGFGGVCQSNGEGDPVVLYDQVANRWLVSQFAGTSNPTDECVAVSTTSDATGSWYRYDFHLGSNFFDYPKLAVWPDGYYLSMNVFNAAGTAWIGSQPFVFDRAKMLLGQAATFQTTGNLGTSSDPILPADLDGSTLPPSGAPETFVRWPQFTRTYQTYHYHVDWVTPGNSTFTTFAAPAAAAFTAACANCVVQPSGGYGLDTLADRLMFRLAYRNFGDHESVVGNYTVASGGVTGIRWFELRNVTSGPETVFQESTYQPDSTYRWMGSAAMDHNGDIAVGFSASSSTVFPSVRYAARLSTDPLGTLGQGETTLATGAGSQTGTNDRWGDYSDMTVDPVNDCTFWFTSEYYPAGNSSFNWRTRIGNFTLPGCGSSPTTGSIAGQVKDTNTNAGVAGATVQLSGGSSTSTTTDGSGNYSFSNLTPAGYTVSATKSTYTSGTGSTANVTVTAGNASTANLTLTSTRGGIAGKVTSTSGGAAISGATVTITSGGSGSTTSDGSGNYSFSGLASGSYTLTASKTGFQPGTPANVTVSPGLTATQNFALTPYPITTTSYKFPTSAVAAPGGDGNGYQTAPASWWSAFDGTVATDASSGTASSQTCGASTRDQEVFTGYAFGSLGSGSVLGVQVQLRGRASSTGNSPKFCIQLSSDGANWTAGKVTSTLKTSLTTYTLGTTSDLWGRSWTAAQLAAGTLRVRITDLANSTARSFYLDGVSVAVTYR
jgi:hypothetical protein